MFKLRTMVATVAALALTASLATVVAATDAAQAEPEQDLVGVFSIEDMTWVLTSQVVDGEMTPVPDGVLVSLRMHGGSAGGQGGCNNYSAGYELDGFDLTFTRIASNQMACLPAVMDVEQAFFTNLGNVAAYQSGGIQMAFLDADGDFILEFDLASEATVVGSWVAQGINNGTGGVESNEFTSLVTADFAEDGTLAGSDGCNDYSTSYEVDGDNIRVAPEMAVTMMFCEEPPPELSQQYYAALGAAETWSVDASGSLELRDADGALQVKYLPAE